MIERASRAHPQVHLPQATGPFVPAAEVGRPDREVTPIEEARAGAGRNRRLPGDSVELSARGRRAAEGERSLRGALGDEPPEPLLPGQRETDGVRDRSMDPAGVRDARAHEDARAGAAHPELGAAPGETAESEAGNGPAALTDEERRVVSEMQQRDREVRQHEQAHAGVGGALAGAPQYESETGPDGRSYAVSGEVSIQLREGKTPEETARLAQQIRRAALAPADPSTQDRRVASQASQMERAASTEAAAERLETEQARREESEPQADVAEPVQAGEPSDRVEARPGGPTEDPRPVAADANREVAARRASDAYQQAVQRHGQAPSTEHVPDSPALSLLA